MKLQGRALEQITAAYTLGTLGPLARRRFEAWLVRDITARRAWQQWEGRLSILAADPLPVRPHDKTWQAIEARIRKPDPGPRSRLRWLLPAMLMVLAAAAWLIWTRLD
jgi:anti-sigma-K factor RskA